MNPNGKSLHLRSVRSPPITSDEQHQTWTGWGGALLPAEAKVVTDSWLFVSSSLKTHYTPTNGDLMRTSLLHRPSCAAQRKPITAWCLSPAVWREAIKQESSSFWGSQASGSSERRGNWTIEVLGTQGRLWLSGGPGFGWAHQRININEAPEEK